MPTVRDNIARLHAYVPGEQPSWKQTTGERPVIKLNTNENPHPPSPKVMEAIRSLSPEALRLYPPAAARPFRETAAQLHGLTPEQVIATNGGDELLRMLVTVFCEPKGDDGRGGIGVTEPTYSLYPVLANIQNTAVTVVDRCADFSLPDDVIAKWNAAGCRLGFIVNPHAPSGRIEPVARLRAMAEAFDGVLVVDEAYVDFAPQSALDLVRPESGRGNVVLLRSLSKGYSLAGLRFGYGLGPADLIATLDKVRDSYNCDILSQAAAVAALKDQDYARACWADVKQQREQLAAALRDRGFTLGDSHTNFLLATPPADLPEAEAIYQALKDQRILIRYSKTPRLARSLRITVGTAEQNAAVLEALDALKTTARV